MWHAVRFFSILFGAPSSLLFQNHPNLVCFSSMQAPRRKAFMVESEKRKIGATNDSADNEDTDYGEPSNIQSEDDQHLRSLLTSLDKDQLVNILTMLGMKIPQAAEGIRAAARPTSLHRKLIVQGFGEETTPETLGDAFSSYGEVEHADVAVVRITGKPLCFGFITFKSLESVKKALEKHKTWVDGHLAYQRPTSQVETPKVQKGSRKLFVSRISSDITTDMFLRFFEKYGEIEKGYVMFDASTGISRGLGLVKFKTVEAAEAAISDPDKIIGRSRTAVRIRWFDKRKKPVQQESVTYAPHLQNSPYAIAPQHYGLQSQVPHPHFSGNEPYVIPQAYAYHPPTEAYQPHFSGYEPYGIPPAYAFHPPTEAYQPHFSGYEPYGIPPAYAYHPPTEAYQPHFSGYVPYEIPPAYQPPTVAYQPHFSGYVPYGIPPAYQPLTVAYQPPTGAYQPQIGFMAYPYYFAYQ